MTQLNIKQSKQNPFLGMILFFLSLRLTTLLTAVEKISYSEELYRGVIAKEFLRGLMLPWWIYQADAHSIGSMIEGLLAVPFFSLLGANLFALKMVPLLFSVATLTLVFIFLERFFNSKTAIIGALLFIFCPPAFLQVCFLALGNHGESLFFSLLTFYFFYAFLFKNPQSLVYLSVFGLAGGFGYAFCNSVLVTVFACLMSWAMMDRASLLNRRFFIFLAAFLLGLVPCFPRNFTGGFTGMTFLFDFFSREQSLLSRIKYLVTGIPSSLGFKSAWGIPWYFFAAAYLGPIFFILFTGSRKLCDKKTLPMVVYLVLFLGVYGLAPMELEGEAHFLFSRYWIPFHLFLFMTTAVLLGDEKKNRWLAGVLLLIGIIGQSRLVFAEPFGRAFSYRAYSYTQLAATWMNQDEHTKKDLKALANFTEGLALEDQRSFYMGIATSPDPELVEAKNIDQAIQALPFKKFPFLYESLSTFIYSEGFQETQTEYGQRVPQEYIKYYYRGFVFLPGCPPARPEIIREGRGVEFSEGYFYWLGKHQIYFNFCPEARKSLSLNRDEKKWFYRGLASPLMYLQFNAGANSESFFKEALSKTPPENRPDLYWGMGWSIGENFPEDILRAQDAVTRLPTEMQADAFRGHEDFCQWYGIKVVQK